MSSRTRGKWEEEEDRSRGLGKGMGWNWGISVEVEVEGEASCEVEGLVEEGLEVEIGVVAAEVLEEVAVVEEERYGAVLG